MSKANEIKAVDWSEKNSMATFYYTSLRVVNIVSHRIIGRYGFKNITFVRKEALAYFIHVSQYD